MEETMCLFIISKKKANYFFKNAATQGKGSTVAHSKGTVHHRRKARWQEHEAAGHNESVLKTRTTAKCIEHFNSNAQEAKTGRALQVRG